MIRKAFGGAATMALALTLTHCTYEDSAPAAPATGEEMVGKPALQVGSVFNWSFTFESATGKEKVAMVKAIRDPRLSPDILMYRRSGNHIQSFYYREEEELMFPPVDWTAPTNVNGAPSAAIAINGPDSGRSFLAYVTTAGKIDIYRIGSGDVIATLTPGSSDFGNPSIAYNTVTHNLELVHREGTRIRHWTGTIGYSRSYTFVSALVPGTGGTGTKVISSVSLTQNTNGKLVAAARILDRSSGGVNYGRLRHWSTSGSGWPFTWTTGNIFGQEDASTEAPSLAPTGEGTVLAVARFKPSSTAQLAQFEINNNVATQLSTFASGHSQPVIMMMTPKRLYMMTLNVASNEVRLAFGSRP